MYFGDALNRSLCSKRIASFDEAGRLRENEKDAPLSGVVPPQSGPVAQLGARFHGMEEVVGSIPTRSTKIPPVALDDFRPTGH